MSKPMDIKFDDGEIKQAFKKYQSGNWEETINICHKIIKRQPNNFLVLELLGLCAYKNNQIEQAIAYYQKSLKVNYNYAETHNNLAVALQDNQQIDAALRHCKIAIKLCPNYAEAWHNLGLILRDKGQFEAAIEHYQKSLEIKPNNAEVYHSLGTISLELGKLSESQKYYQEALKLDKNYLNAHFGLAAVLLKQGSLMQGFSEYEWRCKRQDYINHSFSQPVWDGSKFPGKTLLVYTEQGLGDSIQFIRYIPLVKKLGGRVIVGCNKDGLKLLFTTVSEIDELFVIGKKFPDFDLQIPLMSIPRIFGTNLENIPTEIPYLFVPESKKNQFLETVNSFKIGIAWKTDSQTKTSKKRSCSVKDLQSILNVDNAKFYILQKKVSPEDLEWLNSQTKIHNLSSSFNDLADTAAAIKQLDLVITIDTVIAHLAGALGKPVWVMLNFDSDWRWLTDRKDSPWYPTMRLFRQKKMGDWQGVSQEVFGALYSKLLTFYKYEKTDYPSIIKPGLSVTTQDLLTIALEKYQVENWKEAEEICHFIIQKQPNCTSAFEILALCAKKTDKIDLAIVYYQKAINLNPNNYKTHLGLAIVLKKQQKLDEAIVHNQRAIELKPNEASGWHNLGVIFKIQGNIPEAICCYQKSLEIQPNNTYIYYSWANILKQQGNLTEAKVLYEKCIELNPNHINAHFARGFIILKQGDLLVGFSEYEWRCQRQDYITRSFAKSTWDGSNFAEKTLLIYTEQGLGDSIQFIRYIPLAKKLGGRVIVECNQPGLKLLFTTVLEIDELFVEGEKLPDFDFQISLMSLPRIFQTTLETIPGEIPYLSVPKSINFPIPLSPENNLKVGIFWQTSSTNETGQVRSCSVEYLEEIINIDTVNFYALQKEVSVADNEWLKCQTKIHNLGSSFNDLTDTAAAIEQLDLVITIDTVIAHLAGALGKPVWVMLNFDSDWRWLTDRKDSPWYPTMRLFRQPKIGDWNSVLIEVKEALMEFIESQKNLPDLPANFENAYQYYQQNNLVEAERICRLILEEKPQDFQVLHLLAVLENLAGRNDIAIQLLNQVINLNPGFTKAYSNLAKLMKKEGRLEEAIAHYQKAISLEPNNSSNYSNLGFIFLEKGQIESAIINSEKSIEINPNNSQGNFNLGFAWAEKGDLSKASTYYQKAINLQPDYAQAHNNLGLIFQEKGNLSKASNYYQQALEINPNYAEAWCNLGVVLRKQGQIELAIEYFRKSLELNPDYAQAYNNLGFVFQEKGNLSKASNYYQQALEINPNYAEAWCNLGVVLRKQGQIELAIEYFRKSLELNPDYAMTHNSLGVTFEEEGNFTASIASYQKALELEPNFPEVHLNLSLVWLLLGDLKLGFQEYNWRWQASKALFLIQPEKLWDGSNLEGKKILIYAEQGYGDTIQFIRYIPLVKKQGARITLACQKPLVRLLEKIPEIEQCLEEIVNLTFDVNAPLLELPRIFGTTLDNIPPPIKNLNIPEIPSIKLESPERNYLKVGIVWMTNQDSPTAVKRSCKLMNFQYLLDVAGVSFYSLQKEPGVDLKLLKTLPILDLSSQLNDFADTAGIITKLDLVITVDTAVAHLAGTLGKPVWILLPFVPDWRWMLDRNDSPWYPTARLFRQPKRGDWNSVLIEVKEALMEFIESQKNLPDLPANFENAYQYYQQNNLVEAERICRLILEEKPQDFQVLHLLAVLENLAGRNDIAIQLLNQVINLNPGFTKAYSNLAKLMKKEGRLEEAIAHYQKAIELEPNNSSNYSSLGWIFLQKGQIDLAIINYKKSRKINPNSSWININLGFVWEKNGNLPKANTYYQKAIEIHPNHAEAWCRLGNILQKQGQFELAIEYCQKSLELNPDYIEANHSLGYIFFQLGKLAESQKYYEQAIKKYYEQAIELNTNHVNAHFGLANALLKQGNFIPGFSKYEWRWKTQGFIGRNLSQPVWDGSNFPGQTLLVYTEQGLGDSIQFIRYIPLVKKLGGRVIVECNQAGLKLLFTTVSEIDELFIKGEKLPDFDLQIPLMSLPRILQTTPETIPTEIPYLSVPKSIDFPIPLAPENNLKLGICWQTSSTTETSQRRSCPVEYLEEIINIDTVNFYILQKEVSVADNEWLKSQTKIHNLSSSFNDLADTAAAIKQLDLVITIDTVIAHLAGALGKPVWVMLNFDSDWRWLTDRKDSPWYPTMRLFRQAKIGDWHSIIKQIKNSLIDLVENAAHVEKKSRIISLKLPESGVKKALGKYTSNKLKKTVNNYSKLLQTALEKYKAGNFEEAEQICHLIIQDKPDVAGAFEILGLCAQKTDKTNLVITYCQKAISLNPNNEQTYLNLAIALKNQHKFNAAIIHNQKALSRKPNYAEAWHNLGQIFKGKGEITESIRCYQKALSIRPNYIDAHFGFSLIFLKQGDFIQGFSEYEWRCKRQDYETRSFGQPVWDGSNFPGKTLFIYTEQGLGDSIQFIRYIPLVKKLGGRVIVECNQAGLKLLFTTVSEIDELFVKGEKLPDFDLQIPLMSLPRIFQTTLETIPTEIPYLSVPKSIDFPIPLAPENNLKVGICWQTSSTIKTSQRRSCPVEYLEEIINIDTVNFYILQKEVSVADNEWLKSQTQIHNLSSSFNDLTDTAAVIKQLDLVITIDTVIAHLAGALGKPVWVMLNFDSDWRWLTDRKDSPWYPTMRLFRQAKIGYWNSVLKQVKESLENLLEHNSPTNKISERTAIKLPEEAIQKALAQYKSSKLPKNTPSSTFINSPKNLQTQGLIPATNSNIKEPEHSKKSTSEIIKIIAINWPLNHHTGWGIYGINLTLQLLQTPGYKPLLLTPPSIQPGTLNPLHQALLNPAFNEQKNLQNQLKNQQGKKLQVNLPILQALNSNFSISNNLIGTQNIGIIFSENTKFTSEQINRAQAYNLIITGSTWNTNVLESNGIKPLQKVLQGIDQTIFHPAPKSNTFSDRFVIFSGGKLEYRKGQDIVIAAFKIFQKRHPEALLITAWHNFWPQFMAGIEQTGNVVGLPKISPNKHLQITQWLLENDIPSSAVIDVGIIPNYMVGQILREADVAVFTNRCEGGTNLVAMESLACGIPTIISANTGHLDIINDSHCYPLRCQKSVKPTPLFPGVEGWGESDVEEVVEMLEKVYSDPKNAKLKSNAAVNFMQDLTWEKQIQRLLVTLQNII